MTINHCQKTHSRITINKFGIAVLQLKSSREKYQTKFLVPKLCFVVSFMILKLRVFSVLSCDIIELLNYQIIEKSIYSLVFCYKHTEYAAFNFIFRIILLTFFTYGLLVSGSYWIDPNEGCIDDAFRVYCDFEKQVNCIDPKNSKVQANYSLIVRRT